MCIESLSIDLTRPMLESASRSVAKLSEKIEECVPFYYRVANSHKRICDRVKTVDAAKLQDEYAKLVEGLQESLADESDTDAFMGNPGRMLSYYRDFS